MTCVKVSRICSAPRMSAAPPMRTRMPRSTGEMLATSVALSLAGRAGRESGVAVLVVSREGGVMGQFLQQRVFGTRRSAGLTLQRANARFRPKGGQRSRQPQAAGPRCVHCPPERFSHRSSFAPARCMVKEKERGLATDPAHAPRSVQTTRPGIWCQQLPGDPTRITAATFRYKNVGARRRHPDTLGGPSEGVAPGLHSAACRLPGHEVALPGCPLLPIRHFSADRVSLHTSAAAPSFRCCTWG